MLMGLDTFSQFGVSLVSFNGRLPVFHIEQLAKLLCKSLCEFPVQLWKVLVCLMVTPGVPVGIWGIIFFFLLTCLVFFMEAVSNWKMQISWERRINKKFF